MKKLIISSVLGVALAASTAFGQGYINFSASTKGTVWNATGTSSVYSGAPGTPLTDSGFDATFLWSASSSASPMPNAAGVATNDTTAYSYTGIWLDVSNSAAGGGSWTVATTGGAGVVGSPANELGSFSYDGGTAFALDGATSSGEAINLFVIAWETEGGLYTTMAAAEAAHAPIGYSSVFSYTLGAAPPATPPAATVVPKFGIGPAPEPTTLALAGLGGLSMLFLRRKKA